MQTLLICGKEVIKPKKGMMKINTVPVFPPIHYVWTQVFDSLRFCFTCFRLVWGCWSRFRWDVARRLLVGTVLTSIITFIGLTTAFPKTSIVRISILHYLSGHFTFFILKQWTREFCVDGRARDITCPCSVLQVRGCLRKHFSTLVLSMSLCWEGCDVDRCISLPETTV